LLVIAVLYFQSTPLGSLHASGDTGLSPGQHHQRTAAHDDDRNRGALLNKVVVVDGFLTLFFDLLFSVVINSTWY